MLTLGPSLVPWVEECHLGPGLSSSFSSGGPVGRTACMWWMCYDVLREWFKFRPTTAGQTVVLRTGAWHKATTILSQTREILAWRLRVLP